MYFYQKGVGAKDEEAQKEALYVFKQKREMYKKINQNILLVN